MKRIKATLLTLLCGFSMLNASERISLNEGWKFIKLDTVDIDSSLHYNQIKEWILPTGNRYRVLSSSINRPDREAPKAKFADVHFNDSDWRNLDLPHDWGIEGPFVQDYPGETAKLPWFGVAWYRKNIYVGKEDKDKQIYLDIDGAMSYATVWCNGNLVGGWPYGYASFRVDLTPYIKIGSDNIIAIRIDNPDDSSRWYPGGGVYRNVWLEKSNKVHVAHWGTFVKLNTLDDGVAIMDLDIAIENLNGKELNAEVTTYVYEGSTTEVKALKPLASVTNKIKLHKGDNQLKQAFKIANPELWNIENPNLYRAITYIKVKGKTLDKYVTPFGIRTIDFNTKGFFLNGERVRLQGVCMHHDLGALGAAFNYRAQERQLEILKEMGVNAIRTSHNPPSPEMLELCDRMGFLVIDEFVDTWLMPKKKNGYATIFNDWHEPDLRAFIRRDRNHPSIIMWSTGNEVGEQHTKEGQAISQRLTDIVHDEDTTRPATIGCDNPQAPFNGFEKTTDIYGFNYKPYQYDKFSIERPQIPFYGSETASCISSRGEYLFPVDNDKSGGKIGFHMSSYDLYAPNWASAPDVEFAAQDSVYGNAGEFVWTGFDYLGEPTPFTSDMSVLTNYHDPKERAEAEAELKRVGKLSVLSRSSYFGIVDLAGFKKDRFYIYQARWRENHAMAHILPHWNWPNRVGLITPVHVYTSGDSAELFLNGKSLGRKEKGKYQYRLRWDDVVYEPGELKVVAYKDGEYWATDLVKTSKESHKIELQADRAEMDADGNDLIFVTAKIVDENGVFVPDAMDLVSFSIEGSANIVATDNGDQTSHASFQNTDIKAFNGLCLAIIKSKKGDKGVVRVKAEAKGLQPSEIELLAK